MAVPRIPEKDAIEREFFRTILRALNANQIPYLVGGAHALAFYTGAVRDTKDFDIFVYKEDCERILGFFSNQGFATEMTHPHWLGKILFDGCVVDVIFSSGNGLATVDQEWFRYAVKGEMHGIPVRFSPPEEMIYSKAYIMERERFDGADIAHLLLTRGDRLDWDRLLRRIGPHWKILLAHLILFEFSYPSERDRIPSWVIAELQHRLKGEREKQATRDPICFGTFVSREQYLIDIQKWGFADARRSSPRSMTDEEISQWTNTIGEGR